VVLAPSARKWLARLWPTVRRRFGFKPADEIIQAEAKRNDPEKAKAYEEELALAQADWERFCRPRPNDLWQVDLSTFYIRGLYRVWLVWW
jgi:hypothetical protein